MGQSAFGNVIFLVWVGPINPPTTKPYAAIINYLDCFSYLPCSFRPSFLHISLKWKKNYSKYFMSCLRPYLSPTFVLINNWSNQLQN